MTYAAPGKLFTTGAWAILEGAPAVVLAVDRYAIASAGTPSERPEVVAVARRAHASVPSVDVSSLERDGRKLGLGSSAAAAVAAAACVLGTTDRRAVFDLAFAAHADIQPRGSGGDVAAATWGGAIVVQRQGGQTNVRQTSIPAGVVWRAFALPRSARTSDAVDRWNARKSAAKSAMDRLITAAELGAAAVLAGNGTEWVRAASTHVEGLSSLAESLDLPLVPPEVVRAREVLGAAVVGGTSPEIVLLPSGAGGGDTVLWLGARAPTDHEVASLAGAGLDLLDLRLDTHGVHLMTSRASRDRK
ncbi:MAG: GHMP family kinase ATP-binding protein [Polyangiales bacterium]